ncbi:MAG: hypothetical protein M3314_12195 [Actinomycetota bacterium]|nr:hypothetical protein [Actinomycetota bacterium]
MTALTRSVISHERRSVPFRLTVTVAAVTIGAGLVQLMAPGFVLGLLNGESTTSTRQLFAIVGMFMAVVGGVLLHGLMTHGERQVILLWAGVQKAAAGFLVTHAVTNDVVSGLALVVALNDLVSSGLIFWYRSTLRNAP